jgi:hypothetical protein
MDKILKSMSFLKTEATVSLDVATMMDEILGHTFLTLSDLSKSEKLFGRKSRGFLAIVG